jgi:hypothetical protein
MVAQRDLFARPSVGDGIPAAAWVERDKGSPSLLRLADRHYSRQTPGSNQCCRPGVNLVLTLDDGTAAWVTWRPIPEVGRKDGLEAWECTLFRNEGRRLSSELVREATAITHRRWGWPPRDGLITAVDPARTKPKRHPGYCFRLAGWVPFDKAERSGLVWLRAPHPERTERAA